MDIKYTQEFVTPEQAAKYLANSVPNRSVPQSKIRDYADTMLRGYWDVNGENIKFDEFGRLMDGQTRLKAIILAGIPVELIIARDVPIKVFPSIDGGQSRKASHFLDFLECQNSTKISGALRILMAYQRGQINTQVRHQVIKRELGEFYAEHSRISEFVNVADRAGRMFRGSGFTPSAALFFFYAIDCTNPTMAQKFTEKLLSGSDLSPGSPILALRYLLQKKQDVNSRMNVATSLAMAIKAWDFFTKGKSSQILRFTSKESFPLIAGCPFNPSKKSRDNVAS